MHYYKQDKTKNHLYLTSKMCFKCVKLQAAFYDGIFWNTHLYFQCYKYVYVCILSLAVAS